MAALPDPEPMTRAIADHLETTLGSVSGIRDELIKKSLIYTARPKARPTATPISGFFRVRYDHVDSLGKISLRRAGRMHHLGVGATHAGKPVTILITDTQTTVIHNGTGEVLATNTIDPGRTYWRNNQKEPGRWPGSLSQNAP